MKVLQHKYNRPFKVRCLVLTVDCTAAYKVPYQHLEIWISGTLNCGTLNRSTLNNGTMNSIRYFE